MTELPQSLEERISEFWEGKLLRHKPTLEVECVNGLTMRLHVGTNSLDSCFAWVSRPVDACWFDALGVAAYAQAQLVGPKRGTHCLDAEDALDALDSLDQASCDFAALLMTTHIEEDPFSCALDGARWLANFKLLELHPSRRGHGLGVRLGAQLLDVLRNAYPIGMFVLKPFPLQYSRGDGPREKVLAREECPEQFAKDVLALKRLYAEAWGAAPLPGSEDHLLVVGSAPFRVCADTVASRWWIERGRAPRGC